VDKRTSICGSLQFQELYRMEVGGEASYFNRKTTTMSGRWWWGRSFWLIPRSHTIFDRVWKKSVIPCTTPETRDGRRHINRSTGPLAVRGGFALDIASSIWTVTPLPLALQRNGLLKSENRPSHPHFNPWIRQWVVFIKPLEHYCWTLFECVSTQRVWGGVLKEELMRISNRQH
jgi:hypothetical protein